MRSVFVFPAWEREETSAALDRHLLRERDSWTLVGGLYINIDDEQTGCLFSDWDPHDVAVLEAAVGHRPTWAVQIDISGRIDGTTEVHQLVQLLLQYGGFAFDDYSAHPWTLREIESGTMIDGRRRADPGVVAAREIQRPPWPRHQRSCKCSIVDPSSVEPARGGRVGVTARPEPESW
jgi:hypothetical protein